MNNKKLGIGTFLLNLAPAWFSALAPFFLIFSIFALIMSIVARFSEKINKSDFVRVLFWILSFIGAISTLWIVYELTRT